jgi:hypothetical protein
MLMSEAKYFGVKGILLPVNNRYEGRLLSQCEGKANDESILHAISTFEGRPMVGIYRLPNNFVPEHVFKEDFESYYFVGGYLTTNFDPKKMEDKQVFFDKTPVNLGRMVDIVSQDHLKVKNLNALELKMFTFMISDDQTDLYRIIHVDPILAYLDAEKNDNAPLKLESTQSLYAGMQFNRGKGAPNIDDVY